MAQSYDELMALGKEAAFQSNLPSAMRYLRMAQEIENTSKVRKRIKQIQRALEESSDEENDDKENNHPNPQRSKSDHNENQETTKPNPENSRFLVS